MMMKNERSESITSDRGTSMKESKRVAVSILCFIAGGLLVGFAVSHLDKTRGMGNQNGSAGQSNAGFPPQVGPFIPMVWAGAGWYYGHWYEDEDTYNNDVNVNRDVNRYDDNEGNARYQRAPEYDREGDSGYGRGGGRRG